MNRKIILISLIIIFSFLLASCNKTRGIDASKLDAQTQGAIIARSGTTYTGGTPEKNRLALADAENRLRSGGGLLGNKPLSFGLGQDNDSSKNSTISTGISVNPYLWRGSLETIDFMPLSSANPFAGIIITDWYTGQNNPNERCKINIFIMIKYI